MNRLIKKASKKLCRSLTLSLCLSLCICLSISLSVSISLSISLYLSLSLSLSIYLSICLSTYLSIYLSVTYLLSLGLIEYLICLITEYAIWLEFTLSYISRGLLFPSVNLISIYKNPDWSIFKRINFSGEISTNWPDGLSGANVYKLLNFINNNCWQHHNKLMLLH